MGADVIGQSGEILQLVRGDEEKVFSLGGAHVIGELRIDLNEAASGFLPLLTAEEPITGEQFRREALVRENGDLVPKIVFGAQGVKHQTFRKARIEIGVPYSEDADFETGHGLPFPADQSAWGSACRMMAF